MTFDFPFLAKNWTKKSASEIWSSCVFTTRMLMCTSRLVWKNSSKISSMILRKYREYSTSWRTQKKIYNSPNHWMKKWKILISKAKRSSIMCATGLPYSWQLSYWVLSSYWMSLTPICKIWEALSIYRDLHWCLLWPSTPRCSAPLKYGFNPQSSSIDTSQPRSGLHSFKSCTSLWAPKMLFPNCGERL